MRILDETGTNSGPGAYKFATHRDYLFEPFEGDTRDRNVVLVVQAPQAIGRALAEWIPSL